MKLTYLDETKVMRDPIHHYIHVDLQVIWDCINAKEFQRLRRIHQLGGTYQVYHTAEHSRFGHSLGVYEITRRMIGEVSGLKKSLSEYEQVTLLLAALLHDIGHGPFSHAFEGICPLSHEQFTKEILLNDSDIHQILVSVDQNLPNDVALVISHNHPNKLLEQIVSSQLDADRMDYLLRDAYFTGTSYGEFDLERVLRTLKVVNNQIVVKETGVHTIEDYIMARYHMYWQVYFHPTARSFEALLVLVFRRLSYLFKNDYNKVKHLTMFDCLFLKECPSVEDHYKLDEACCLYGFSLMLDVDDVILKDLAKRILNRQLFEYMTISDENVDNYRYLIPNLDPEYYLFIDKADQRPYKPYSENFANQIYVANKKGDVVELSIASLIVKAITQGENKTDIKLYYPKLID
ncbi:MAG: HD domain-containing protein [Erysipelotrichaceae bacterium]